MKTAADAITYSLRASSQMLSSLCADLSGAEWMQRPTKKSNCAAWTVGHLIMSDRGVLARVGVTDLPPLPEGFESRFGRDNDAPAATDFGDPQILLPRGLKGT